MSAYQDAYEDCARRNLSTFPNGGTMKAKDSPSFHPALSESVKVKADIAKLAAKLNARAGRAR